MERIFETQQVTKSDHCSLLISVVLGGTSPPDGEAGPSSLSPPFTCYYYLYCFDLYLSFILYFYQCYRSFRFLLVPVPSLNRPEQYLPHYPEIETSRITLASRTRVNKVRYGQDWFKINYSYFVLLFIIIAILFHQVSLKGKPWLMCMSSLQIP